MKLDKDTLIKNRFWIVLGVAGVLTLTGWVILLITVPSKVNKEQSAITKSFNDASKYNDVVNPEDVKTAEQEAKASQQDQANSWYKLYEKQAKLDSLSRWPKQLEDSVKSGKFALEVVVHPKGTKDNALPEKDEENKFVGKLTDNSNESQFEVKPRKGTKTEFFYFLEGDTKITEGGKAISVKDLTGLKDRYVVVTYYQGKFFGEKFTRNEVDLYKKHHAEQFDAVFKEVGAVNVLGETVVQFRHSGGGAGFGMRFQGQPPLKVFGPKGKGVGAKERDDPDGDDDSDADYLRGDVWIYDPVKKNKPPADNRFFAYVPKWNFDKDAKPEDIAEEIWIAQENLWVERELFKRIKQANDSVAAFKPVDPKDKDLGKTRPVKFKNYYWEIELQLVNNNSVQVKLRNLRPYQQEVGNLHFLLTLAKGAKPVIFPPVKDEKQDARPFEGAPVGPAGSKDGDTFSTKEPIPLPAGAPRADGIFAVEQVLTWETAAVKRIDLIVIGAAKDDMALGHRQAGKTLVPYKKKPKDDKQEVDPKLERDPKKGFGGVPGPGPGPGPGFPGREMAGSQSTTAHGQVRERYLEVTPQARKLPVCLVLIVDPDHMAHVEAAFLDSPLRFLITQVMWQRFEGSLRPPERPDEEAKKGKDIPGVPGISPPETTTSGADEMENLELAIYGVITIYERPNRPQSQVQAPPDGK